LSNNIMDPLVQSRVSYIETTIPIYDTRDAASG